MKKIWLKSLSYYRLNIISMSVAICAIMAMFSTLIYFGINMLGVFESVSNNPTTNWNYAWRNIGSQERTTLDKFLDENNYRIENAVFEVEVASYYDDIGVSVGLVSFSDVEALPGLFNVSLADGRFPTNDDEIALNQKYLELRGLDKTIGDSISILDNDYIIVGIINGYSSFNSEYCFIVNNTASPDRSNMYVNVSSEVSNYDNEVLPVFYDMVYALTGDYNYEGLLELGIQDIGNREDADIQRESQEVAIFKMLPVLIVGFFGLCVLILVFVTQLVDTMLERRSNDIALFSVSGLSYKQLKGLLFVEILFVEAICIPLSYLCYILFVSSLKKYIASLLPSNSISEKHYFLSFVVAFIVITIGMIISYSKSYRSIIKKEPISLMKGRNDAVILKPKKASTNLFDVIIMRNISRNPNRTLVIGLLVLVSLLCAYTGLGISSVIDIDNMESHIEHFGSINSKYAIYTVAETDMYISEELISNIDKIDGVEVTYVANSGFAIINDVEEEIGILSNEVITDFHLEYSEEPAVYCFDMEAFIDTTDSYHDEDIIYANGDEVAVIDTVLPDQIIAANFPSLFCNEAFANEYISNDNRGCVKLNVDTDLSYEDFKNQCEDIDEYRSYLSISYETYGIKDVFQEIALIKAILNIVSIVLCVFVLICVINIIEQILFVRSREIAILEVLGETPCKISHSVGLEFGIISLVSSLFAMLLSFVVNKTILRGLQDFISYKYSIMIMVIFVLLVYFVSYAFSYYRISRSMLCNRLKEE